MFNKILVGYDGTDSSDDALALAQLLARPAAGQLIAACVYWRMPMARGGRGGRDVIREDAELAAATLVERYGDQIEVRAIADGSPAHALHELAEADGVDLIAVGATGRGSIGRTLGTTADRLLHSAQCPVSSVCAGPSRTRPTSLRGRHGLRVPEACPRCKQWHTNVRSSPKMATTTKMATATNSSPGVKTPATHRRGIPAARLGNVVDRTRELSDEVLGSVEQGQRAAIEAAGRFLVTIEEALPQEVEGTSEVAKKITESGREMADRLVHTQYDFLREVIDSAAKSLSSRNGAQPSAAK